MVISLVISYVLALLTSFAAMKTADVILARKKRSTSISNIIPMHEREWYDDVDAVSAFNSTELPKLMADTTWARLEKQWIQENPTPEDILKDRIKVLKAQVDSYEELVEKKSSLIANQERQLRGYRSALSSVDLTETLIIPKEITEEEFHKLSQSWTLKLVSRVKTHKNVLVIPESTVAIPKQILARDYQYGGMVKEYAERDLWGYPIEPGVIQWDS